MGYTTKFEGRLKFTPRLTMEQYAALHALHDAEPGDLAQQLPGWPIAGRPERSYCQWVPTKDGEHLEWDGGEKFYYYVEWLQYICGWLGSQGRAVNGEIKWAGEDRDDRGTITVKGSIVLAQKDDLVPKGKTKIETARNAFAKIVEATHDHDNCDDCERAHDVAAAALELLK